MQHLNLDNWEHWQLYENYFHFCYTKGQGQSRKVQTVQIRKNPLVMAEHLQRQKDKVISEELQIKNDVTTDSVLTLKLWRVLAQWFCVSVVA